MNRQQKVLGRKRHAGIALCFALAFVAAAHWNILSQTDNWACDTIYQTEQALDGTVFVLGVDERAMEQLGPFQTWERGVMADILDALNANPLAMPAVIGVDMMYYGQTKPEQDARLAEAAARYGNVVVGASASFKAELVAEQDGQYTVDSFAVELLEQPYPALRAASRQGHLNTFPDGDGVVRTSKHTISMEDGSALPSFAYAVYQLYAEKNGLPAEVNPPMDARQFWYVPFAAKPGGYNDFFSVADVLSGELPPELFADAIVLIGPYAPGMRDAYMTPIDRSTPMYGVEIHANILQALLDGDRFMTRVPAWMQSVLLLVVLTAAYFAFRHFGPRISTPILAVLLGGYLLGAYQLGQQGWMLQIIYLPVGLVTLYIFWLAVGYLRELLDRKQMTDTFKKYVAPQVVDEIIKGGHENLRLGGEKREIACMFVDIRGFTPMSESLAPEQVVEVLNESLALTSEAVFAHGGTLDKFIGDATMAIYNAPLNQKDYIYCAVLTAWDIMQGADELAERMKQRYGRSVRFGIGLNAGAAVIGNIGTAVRMDYTAIGDTVNTAARLESRAAPDQVLMSEAVYEAVKERVEAVPLGEMPLKGKTVGVRVFELRGIHALGKLHKTENNEEEGIK